MGFAIRNDSPPGAGTPYVTGFTMNPNVVIPAATSPTVKTGRHRRDGSVPVGNRIRRKPSAVTVGPNTHSPIAPASTAPGKAPGRQEIPATLYAPLRLNTVSPSPTPCRIHPMGLRARRTINAPIAA